MSQKSTHSLLLFNDTVVLRDCKALRIVDRLTLNFSRENFFCRQLGIAVEFAGLDSF